MGLQGHTMLRTLSLSKTGRQRVLSASRGEVRIGRLIEVLHKLDREVPVEAPKGCHGGYDTEGSECYDHDHDSEGQFAAVGPEEMDDDDAVSMLVVGTEAKQVLVLDAVGSSILVSATLVSVPVFLGVTGLYSVDYRVVCACRDGNVYTVKGGELTGTVIELESMPSCLVRLEKVSLGLGRA